MRSTMRTYSFTLVLHRQWFAVDLLVVPWTVSIPWKHILRFNWTSRVCSCSVQTAGRCTSTVLMRLQVQLPWWNGCWCRFLQVTCVIGSSVSVPEQEDVVFALLGSTWTVYAVQVRIGSAASLFDDVWGTDLFPQCDFSTVNIILETHWSSSLFLCRTTARFTYKAEELRD